MKIFSLLLKKVLRKKALVISCLLTPFLSILIFSLVFSNEKESKLRIGLIDNAKSIISKELINSLNNGEYLLYDNLNNYENLIYDNKLDVVLTIDKEKLTFSSAKLNDEIIFLKEQLKKDYDTYRKLEANLNEEKLVKTLTYLNNPNHQSYEITYLNDFTKVNNLSHLSSTMLIMLIVANTFVISNEIIKDRNSGIWKRIILGKNAVNKYIMSYFLLNFSYILFQIIIITLSFYLLNIKLAINLLYLSLLFLALGITVSALNILISIFAENENNATTIMNIILLPGLMLAGAFWPISIVPSFIQRIADFIFYTWFFKAFDAILERDFTIYNLNLIYLSLFGLVMLIVAITLFKNRIKQLK